MKTYLEACKVPTVRVGDLEIPRLIMGIHPFDGCGYVSPQRDREMLDHFADVQRIVDVLACATGHGITVVQTDHMVPHLNRQHLTAGRRGGRAWPPVFYESATGTGGAGACCC